MLRPWKTVFNISFDAQHTLVEQITAGIRQEIIKGRLEPGAPLPGSRLLAKDLGVNRKTVVFAYEALIAEGWAESRSRAGTFVSQTLPSLTDLLSKVEKRNGPDFPVRNFVASPLTDNALSGNLLFFSEGSPDVRLAPLRELSRAYRRILERQGRWRLLGYGSEQGAPKLREMLALLLSRDRGLRVTADALCITRGSQMALYLAAKVLVRPGDVVAMENPGYPAARRLFEETGAVVRIVNVDADGIDTEMLEQTCRKEKVKAVYVTPHHQFPTTVTMKATRRMHLLELSLKYGFAIIEDDYDHEFHFGAGNKLALGSNERAANVIYISSFSKLIAPAMRIGYVTGPETFMKSLVNLRIQIDRQGDTILEHAIADLLEDGTLRRHTRKSASVYKNRRDRMELLLQQYFHDEIQFQKPEGGLAFWIRFTREIDFPTYYQKLKAQNIQVVPPGTFYENGLAQNTLRLGYGSLNEKELQEGIETLARVFHELQ